MLPTVRREGLVAVVFDSPTSAEALGRTAFNGAAGELLAATIRAVVATTGRVAPADLLDEVAVLHAVARPTPGGKPPKIAAVRACRDRLVADLDAARPRMVLSVGAAACAALSGTGKATPISKWRGQTRWLELPSGRVPWVATISPGSVVARSVLYRDLSQDVWKAWTAREPVAAPDVDTVVPRDVAALGAALARLEGASVVSVDVETTGLSPYRDRLLSVGFGADYGDGSGLAVVVPYELLDDDRVRDLCWDATYRTSRRTVFQNGIFDMRFLAYWLGEPIPGEASIGDTLYLGSLLDERPRKDRIGSLGLKEQASYRYDKQDYHWDWARFYADMAHDGHPAAPVAHDPACKYPHPDGERRADFDGLHEYQSLDVYFTARLWFDLVAEAEAESPRLMECHDRVIVPAAKALAACEMAGAPLDFAWLDSFAAWLRRRIERRERALYAVVPGLGATDGFSAGSPAQVADLMYDVWRMTPDVRRKYKKDGGGVDRSTDREHIESAIAKYLRAPDHYHRRGARWLRMLLRWRADKKNLSTYSETLVARADDDGRLRADFLLHGTSTGRLSSAEPNLQNIPAVDDKATVGGRTAYTLRGGRKTYWPARRAFAPPPGYLWVEADYSQLELRVAAWLSGDERLREVFVRERDIHREVAATMFSKPPEEVTKPERYLAKAVDFGVIYGRTGKAIATGAEMDFYERDLGGRRWDEPTADAFVAKFMRGYPQLSAWLASNAEGAIRDYFVETPFGRRRRFPIRPRSKWERLSIERQANNTPIQSAASDICLMAMARIAPQLPEGATILFPVHDSICLEVREDLVDEVVELLKREMGQDLDGVPLTIDVEVGPSWADVH